jgi:flagellar biosynthesis/type III secretory pathway protein FliH
LSIAKKIVSHELDIQPEKVLSMVRYAIGECRAEGKRVLKVSPQDYDKVTNNKNTLCDSSNQGKELVIEKDERLSKGDCVIETDTGLVDAKIDTQLQIIREAFMNVGVMGNYDA